MAFDIFDNINPNVALPLDKRYWVDTYSQLNTGILYDAMPRFVRSGAERGLYLYNSGSKTWEPYGKAIQGLKGEDGKNATIKVGTVTQGSAPSVTNVGTDSEAILDFVLVKGDRGEQGLIGLTGTKGDKGDQGNKGDNYRIDARGSEANRATFNGEARDFVYLIDLPTDPYYGYVYFNNGDGTWSNPFRFVGDAGWTPVHSLVALNENTTVTKLQDFIGGEGTKPLDTVANTYYVTASGYSTDVNKAINIKGPKGETGQQGVQGLRGLQGIQGLTGPQGMSIWIAYADDSVGTNRTYTDSGQIYVSFIQSEGQPALTAFTTWHRLQGAQGIQGIQGNQGIQGVQGVQGETGLQGKSAYQVAVDNGFIGTEQEWLATIKGGKGIHSPVSTVQQMIDLPTLNNPDYPNNWIIFCRETESVYTFYKDDTRTANGTTVITTAGGRWIKHGRFTSNTDNSSSPVKVVSTDSDVLNIDTAQANRQLHVVRFESGTNINFSLGLTQPSINDRSNRKGTVLLINTGAGAVTINASDNSHKGITPWTLNLGSGKEVYLEWNLHRYDDVVATVLTNLVSVQWSVIGDNIVDLSNYYTKSEVDNLFDQIKLYGGREYNRVFYNTDYPSIRAASNAAESWMISTGKTAIVHVKPGVYTESSINRRGVHMHFDDGAIVYMPSRYYRIFDDANMLDGDEMHVYGKGVFFNLYANDNDPSCAWYTSKKITGTFEAKTIDYLRVSNSPKFVVRNTKILFSTFVSYGNSLLITENCTYVNGIYDKGYYAGWDSTLIYKEATFLGLEAAERDTHYVINDKNGVLVATLVHTNFHTGFSNQPNISAMTGPDVAEQYGRTYSYDQTAVVSYVENSQQNWGNNFDNHKIYLEDCRIIIRKEHAMGMKIISRYNNPGAGFFIKGNLEILDQTVAKDSVAVVTGQLSTVTDKLDFWVDTIVTSCLNTYYTPSTFEPLLENYKRVFKGMDTYSKSEIDLKFSTLANGNLVLNKVGHGLAVHDIVSVKGTKAIANSAEDAEVAGYVVKVIDANQVELARPGDTIDITGRGYTVGTAYLLSATVHGAVQEENVSAGNISKPVLLVMSSTQAIFVNMRGFLVTENGGLNQEVVRTIPNHGLFVQAITNTSGGLAKADNGPNAEVFGWVKEVIDVNTVREILPGSIVDITGLMEASGAELIIGETYVLSATVAGKVQLSNVDLGQVSKPILQVYSANRGVFMNMRGIVLNNPNGGHVITDTTTSFPNRTKLQFKGAIINDDEINDASIVSGYVLDSDTRLSDARRPVAHPHDGSDITTGTIADARLSGNVPLKNAVNTWISNNLFSGVDANTTVIGAIINGIYQFRLRAGGKQEWADPATGTSDTNLYRSGASHLKTDGSLIIGGVLYGGKFTNGNGSDYSLATTGPEIKTNTAANIAAKIINTVSNATGDLMQWIKGTAVVAKMSVDGVLDAAGFKKNGSDVFVEITNINPSAIVAVYDIPATEIAKLEDNLNWTGNNYTGTPIVGTFQAQEYNNATYWYKCVADNKWIRR